MQTELPNYQKTFYYGACTNMVKLLVTERCNLRCPFCTSPPKRAEELTISEIEEICSVFYESGMRRVKISGGSFGEPLVRKDIPEIVDLLKKIGYQHIGIATNGQLLSEALVEDLVNRGLTWVTHSLTTIDETKYQLLYGAPLKGATLGAVRRYAGLERYQLNAVLLKTHNADSWANLVEFAQSRNVNLHFMELIGHSENMDYYRENFISAEIVKAELMRRCYSYQYKKLDMTHVYCLENGNVSVKQTTHEKDACRVCRRMFVSSDGKVWFCQPENQLHDFRSGAISANSLTSLMSNRYNAITQQGENQRLELGCTRACDGCSKVEP